MGITVEFGSIENLDPDELLKQARKWSDKSAALQESMKAIEGHAQSRDGYISVTYTASAGLQELELNPRAMRMASQDLAAAIKETVREAMNDMQQKMTAAMSEVFGEFNPMEMLNNPEQVTGQAKKMEESLNMSAKDALAGIEEIRRKLQL